jgi:NAD(P)-dependent dehydrogenase (short-subunit alcohol dehydrogenase family)
VNQETDEVAVDLRGRVAVIVGAAGGIGKAVAARLGAAGCRLALVDLDGFALGETAQSLGLGDPPLTFAADITDRPQVDAAAGSVRDAFGAVDILVNAAGTNTRERTLENMSPEQWEKVIAVNLTGVFHCLQAFLPLLRERGGIIVTVVSTAAILVSPGGGAHYCAAKRALLSLNESINVEQGRHGLRACAILPGEVDTPLIDKRPTAPSPERRAAMLRPGDVAEVVYFVATRPPRVAISDVVIWPSAQLAGTYTV